MMKKCAICGHDCKPSAASCTACGEATWVPPPPPTSDEAPTVRRTPIRPPPMAGGDYPTARVPRRGARTPS